MIANNLSASDREIFVDDFAAELAEAVYPVMLRHGAPDNWLDLELELWKTLRKTIKG
jgi:hypothetical protein